MRYLLAAFALFILTWVLLLTAGLGLGQFFDRAEQASATTAALQNQLSTLTCIQNAVNADTRVGGSYQLTTNGSDYLAQRVADMEVPRILFVLTPTAPVLSVTNVTSGTGNCGTVQISLKPSR